LTTLNDIRLLLLGLWLGAAIFFSVVVAPTAFSVLRGFQLPNSGEIAGAIVNRSLAFVNTSGFALGLFLIVTAFAVKRNYERRLLLLELASLAAVTISTGIGQWVITAKIHALRTTIAVPIDQVSADDPRRVAFNSLHSYSVAALGVAIIAALIAFFALAHRGRPDARNREGTKWR